MTLILQGTDNSVSTPAVQGGTGGATTGVYYPASNQVALATNGTQRLLVDANGLIGVNQSSLSNQFTIKSASGIGAALVLQATDAGGNAQILFNGTRNWQIGTGNASSGFSNQLYFYDGTAGVNRATLDSSGNFTLNTSNAGIIFNNSSALTNSTLNDYEQGTFTPTQQSGLTGTVSSITGIYTKVGRIVNIQVIIVGTGLTIGTSSLFMSGLPFAIASGGGGLSIANSANQANQNWRGVFLGASTNFYNVGGGTTGDTSIFISGSYPANF